jgi:hypothetical protein
MDRWLIGGGELSVDWWGRGGKYSVIGGCPRPLCGGWVGEGERVLRWGRLLLLSSFYRRHHHWLGLLFFFF